MASTLPPLSEYRNSPCWPAVDDLLRLRLSALHHLLGSNAIDPASAAEDFSHIVGGLLLEQCIISDRSSTTRHQGPHRLRPVEATLRNLTCMKNAARKSMCRCDEFIHLVRAHHKVKKILGNMDRKNSYLLRPLKSRLFQPLLLWNISHKLTLTTIHSMFIFLRGLQRTYLTVLHHYLMSHLSLHH